MDETTVDENIQKKVDEINQFLDNFEKEHKLVPIKGQNPPQCLQLTLEDIKKKTSEELAEYQYQINEYSFYLQRVINKNRALDKWAKSKLDDMIGFQLPEISPRFGYNERVLIARTSGDICKKLNQFIRKIEMQLDRLYNLPEQIRIIGDSIKEFKFIALKREKNNHE